MASLSCTDDVSLGAWGNGGADAGAGRATGGGGSAGAATGGGGSAGAATGGGGSAGAATGGTSMTCPRGGVPGPLNAPGADVGITMTYTDFTWPGPTDSLEWDFQLENTVSRDGYFWAHEFDFEASNGGFLGLQHRGGYQADPPDGPVQVENMMVFWIASATRAELGDVPYPSARTYLRLDSDSNWQTIHVLYDFQLCRVYHLRMGRQASEPNGDIWYGAWVRDGVTDVETFLGRILVPAARGRLGTESNFASNRIGYASVTNCDTPEPIAALFGFPTADLGSVLPSAPRNHFATPAHCGNSRITEFPDAVRHELAVAP